MFAELGQASKGGIADYSGITYEKLEAQNGVFLGLARTCWKAHGHATSL